MSSAITLNYGISPPKTCRVEVTPSTCQLGLNSAIKGSQNYTNPGGVTFHTYGMTVQDYNAGLRQPQMRTFLGPEYFNSGCSSLYCKDSALCQQSKMAQGCQRSDDMFTYLFAHQSDFTGNNAPQSVAIGSKCSGYNSVKGWELSSTNPTQLKWQAAPDAFAAGCSA